MNTRLRQWALTGLFVCIFGTIAGALAPVSAAPYAALVMDVRSGKVLYSRNADTRLHPASLTKMMTLYVVFQAVEHGEISLDTMVKISRKAAAEPPSKLGLTAGQKIKLRYLIRAAAVKSANDAATALGEAISGSEAAFARRMNRTAKALGMTRSTFKNAHGLTEDGHLSTARDMTILGRHLFYDHPQYFNIFSRQSTRVGKRTVRSTNRRFLAAYNGADGIKTGYTVASGFNLVASAQRGGKRIIATMFGGRSTAQRNAKVAELLDLGFSRAPARVAVNRPSRPRYAPVDQTVPPAGKILRVVRAVAASPFPVPRPGAPAAQPPAGLLVAMQETIEETVTAVQVQARPAETANSNPPDPAAPAPQENTEIAASPPPPRPDPVVASFDPAPEREVVTRISTSGDRIWGINVGRYGSRYQAERVLLKTALAEIETLDTALRKVTHDSRGYNAIFVGMTRDGAARACRRLEARNFTCATMGPT